MNATSLSALRTAPQARDSQDERMDQIRELLVGDILRQTEARLDNLESRLKDLESTVSSRVSALHARIEALSGEVGADRRSTFDELAKSVLELGEHIKRIARD
jgi:archaellum component FlaC